MSAFIPDRLEYPISSLLLLNRCNDPMRGLSDSMCQFSSFDRDSVFLDSLKKLSISQEYFMNINIDDINMDTPAHLTHNYRYHNFVNTIERNERTRVLNRTHFNFLMNQRRTEPLCIDVANWRTVRFFTLPFTGIQKLFEPDLVHFSRFDQPAALFGLVKSVEVRANELKSIFDRFVFVMAKVKASPVLLCTGKPSVAPIFDTESEVALRKAVDSAVRPYYEANIRQQIYFPDRKLVQFDSGKLQTLCALLHERKKGGHKCLIFTQMSKMLDILEVFLNIHGHTYVRLDGATTVDRRQKLMDKFNNDPKLFCFILSTRSGGFGINLTGADTVIFYDSDWNPAMDA